MNAHRVSTILPLFLMIVARCSADEAPEFHVQIGHSMPIRCIAASRDGSRAITGEWDRAIKVWDLGSCRELRTMLASSGTAAVAFFPDGKTALSGHDDGSLRVWDLAKGTALRSWEGHADSVNVLVLSPDGAYAISGGKDSVSAIWDVKEQRMLWSESGSYLGSAAFSPDGRTALFGMDGKLVLREIPDGKPIRTFFQVRDSDPRSISSVVSSVAFSPDGRRAVSFIEKRPIALWDLSTSSMMEQPVIPLDKGYCAFSPDGKEVLLASSPAAFFSWDLRGTPTLKKVFGEQGRTDPVLFLPDGVRALAGGDDGQLMVYDRLSGSVLRALGNRFDAISTTVPSTDGRYALSVTSGGRALLWDLRKGRMIKAVPLGLHPCFALSGGLMLAFVDDPGDGVVLYDLNAEKEIARLRSPGGRIAGLDFSTDGKQLVAASENGTAGIWDVAAAQSMCVLQSGGTGLRKAVFSRDGRRVITLSEDAVIAVWDASGGASIRMRKFASVHVISSYGESAVCSDAGGYVLWNASDGRSEAVPFPPGAGEWGNVQTRIALSPDGTHLLRGYLYGSLILSDMKSAVIRSASPNVAVEELFLSDGTPSKNSLKQRVLAGHSSMITSAWFSPEGKYAYSAGAEGMIRRWDLESGDWIAFLSGTRKNASAWVVYSCDGYWDGSVDCGELVSMSRDMESWSIDQFAVRNNRPDILAERLGGDPATVSAFQAAWYKRLRRAGLSEAGLTGDFRTPKAAMLSAVQDMGAGNGKFVDMSLSFTADGSPLMSYQVYVNDVPLFGVTGKRLGGMTASVTERIELIEGANKIEASCTDSGGAESYRAVQVFRWPGGTSPNLYYLAFGVSEYADPSIPELKYAARDAISLEALFLEMEGRGFDSVKTRVFTDARATRKAILSAKEFLKDARPDDVLVLFLSGHGVQVADVPGLPQGGPAAANGSTYYFVSADSRLADIPGTATNFESIEELLQGIAPRRKLFLMDTCQSGEADDSSPLIAASGAVKGIYARTLSPVNMRGLSVLPVPAAEAGAEKDRWVFNDLVRRSGAIVFSSCRGNEASLEADVWQQGAFTCSILGAFTEPDADSDGDGELSVDELRTYVVEDVPRLVRQLVPGAMQHPVVDRDNLYAKFGFPFAKAGTLPDSLDFVAVSGGEFAMGWPNRNYNISIDGYDAYDETPHRVRLSDYSIATHEVTVGEFSDFVEATGYRTSAESAGEAWTVEVGSMELRRDRSWKSPGFSQTPLNPVVCVSWYDAVAYCNWRSEREGMEPAYSYLDKGKDFRSWPEGWNSKIGNDLHCDWSARGYRLPTEAEWEYAARGGAEGSKSEFIFSNTPDADSIAWYGTNSGGKTHPVGRKRANASGAYDMNGNVSEWCWDWYGLYEKTPQEDPRGAMRDRKIYRGGSWFDSKVDIRNAKRFREEPMYCDNTMGFRLVRMGR